MFPSERFPYLPMSKGRFTILRPMLPMTLIHRTRSVSVFALLDTGSDINILPYGIGLALRAPWDDLQEIHGLPAFLAGYEARALQIQGQIRSDSNPLEPIELVFVWTAKPAVRLIMGHANFFNEFDVCFFASEFAFEIQRHPR